MDVEGLILKGYAGFFTGGKYDLVGPEARRTALADLKEIARLAYGAKNNDELANGGYGRLGLDSSGRVYKFSTGVMSRTFASTTQKMREDCNRLREYLLLLSDTILPGTSGDDGLVLGVEGEAQTRKGVLDDIRRLLGIAEESSNATQDSLLDRRVVVSVLKKVDSGISGYRSLNAAEEHPEYLVDDGLTTRIPAADVEGYSYHQVDDNAGRRAAETERRRLRELQEQCDPRGFIGRRVELHAPEAVVEALNRRFQGDVNQAPSQKNQDFLFPAFADALRGSLITMNGRPLTGYKGKNYTKDRDVFDREVGQAFTNDGKLDEKMMRAVMGFCAQRTIGTFMTTVLDMKPEDRPGFPAAFICNGNQRFDIRRNELDGSYEVRVRYDVEVGPDSPDNLLHFDRGAYACNLNDENCQHVEFKVRFANAGEGVSVDIVDGVRDELAIGRNVETVERAGRTRNRVLAGLNRRYDFSDVKCPFSDNETPYIPTQAMIDRAIVDIERELKTPKDNGGPSNFGKVRLEESKLGLLYEIAKMAYGSKESEQENGGEGRIGMICGHAYKFNTKLGERWFGTSKSQQMVDSCNELRKALMDLTREIASHIRYRHANERTAFVNSIAGMIGPVTSTDLLDRKVVAQVIGRLSELAEAQWGGRNIGYFELASRELQSDDTDFATVLEQAEVRRRQEVEEIANRTARASGLPIPDEPMTAEQERNFRRQPVGAGSSRFVYDAAQRKFVEGYFNLGQPKMDMARVRQECRTIAADYQRGLRLFLGGKELKVPIKDEQGNALKTKEIAGSIEQELRKFCTVNGKFCEEDFLCMVPMLHQGAFGGMSSARLFDNDGLLPFRYSAEQNLDEQDEYPLLDLQERNRKQLMSTQTVSVNRTAIPGRLEMVVTKVDRDVKRYKSVNPDDGGEEHDVKSKNMGESYMYESAVIRVGIKASGELHVDCDRVDLSVNIPTTEKAEELRARIAALVRDPVDGEVLRLNAHLTNARAALLRMGGESELVDYMKDFLSAKAKYLDSAQAPKLTTADELRFLVSRLEFDESFDRVLKRDLEFKGKWQRAMASDDAGEIRGFIKYYLNMGRRRFDAYVKTVADNALENDMPKDPSFAGFNVNDKAKLDTLVTSAIDEFLATGGMDLFTLGAGASPEKILAAVNSFSKLLAARVTDPRWRGIDAMEAISEYAAYKMMSAFPEVFHPLKQHGKRAALAGLRIMMALRDSRGTGYVVGAAAFFQTVVDCVFEPKIEDYDDEEEKGRVLTRELAAQSGLPIPRRIATQAQAEEFRRHPVGSPPRHFVLTEKQRGDFANNVNRVYKPVSLAAAEKLCGQIAVDYVRGARIVLGGVELNVPIRDVENRNRKVEDVAEDIKAALIGYCTTRGEFSERDFIAMTQVLHQGFFGQLGANKLLDETLPFFGNPHSGRNSVTKVLVSRTGVPGQLDVSVLIAHSAVERYNDLKSKATYSVSPSVVDQGFYCETGIYSVKADPKTGRLVMKCKRADISVNVPTDANAEEFRRRAVKLGEDGEYRELMEKIPDLESQRLHAVNFGGMDDLNRFLARYHGLRVASRLRAVVEMISGNSDNATLFAQNPKLATLRDKALDGNSNQMELNAFFREFARFRHFDEARTKGAARKRIRGLSDDAFRTKLKPELCKAIFGDPDLYGELNREDWGLIDDEIDKFLAEGGEAQLSSVLCEDIVTIFNFLYALASRVLNRVSGFLVEEASKGPKGKVSHGLDLDGAASIMDYVAARCIERCPQSVLLLFVQGQEVVNQLVDAVEKHRLNEGEDIAEYAGMRAGELANLARELAEQPEEHGEVKLKYLDLEGVDGDVDYAAGYQIQESLVSHKNAIVGADTFFHSFVSIMFSQSALESPIVRARRLSTMGENNGPKVINLFKA